MRGTGAASKQSQISFSNDWWNDLPFDLQNVKVTSGTRPIGFRYSPFIFNIEASLGGNEIIACGEDSSAELAMTKAMAELTERSAMLSWSGQMIEGGRTSSGWAAHNSEALSKQSAILELIERDAVLAQWYSSSAFLRIDLKTLPDIFKNWQMEELAQSEFPNLIILLSTEGLGPSVSCLFTNDEGFGVSGHATKSDISASIESALAEACRAAHLAIRKSYWADALSLKLARLGKVDPAAHAVYYAYHEAFPEWMFGQTVSWKEACVLWEGKISQVKFDTFGFEVVLQDPWTVGVATHPQILSASWGRSDEEDLLKKIQKRSQICSLDCKSINLKPHIVS